jgi:serine/threonine protein kinase/Tol biopolymer transport system component
MALQQGTRLGAYEVISPLGVGGMGEVYRARDTRLQRDVALKILPETMARDAQRMARFEREAQVLASLNHPNIAAIYGLEETNGVRALVMELVEGETLGERIVGEGSALSDRRSPMDSIGAQKSDPREPKGLPYQATLPIAKQVAEAFEYAHERGVIHRDLKPANVKITPEGTVKVLDFGLAKVLAAQDSPATMDTADSPTLSAMATQAGMILGTAAYMSPEQAKGQKVDRRADIWAFGCVMFEMLSGRKPFEGETISEVLAAVIRAEPDWRVIPDTTPPSIQHLIRRCLVKEPKERLRDIGEARIAIDETISGVGELSTLPTNSTVQREPRGLFYRALPWTVAALAVVALLVTLAIHWKSPSPGPVAPMELSLDISASQQLLRADGPAIVLSPDGSRIAYVTGMRPQTQIYVRELDKSQAKPLEGVHGLSPFFSPDGQWIGYYSVDGKLERVSVFGGAPVVLANANSDRGATWSEDGTIVYSPTITSSLYRVPAAGGEPVEVTHLDAARNQITHRWPQFLPGGKTMIFTASGDNNNFSEAAVEAASLATGEAKVLVENAYFGRYLPSGYLTYISGGKLFAARFDANNLKLTGPSLPILQNIEADLTNGSAQLSFSRTGTAIYLTGQGLSSKVTVALVDRKGNVTPLIKQPGDYFAPNFSPDGKQLALQQGMGNVLVYNLARKTLTPLTFSKPQCIYPVWTPDGKRITCERPSLAGIGQGISWLPSDGTGSMEALTKGYEERQIPFSWSPDGNTLAFAQYSPNQGSWCDIWTLPLGPGGRPGKPEIHMGGSPEHAAASYYAPAFSPDGRWLAYSQYVSGMPQIFVTAYPGPGGKWQVSVDGGQFPVWSRSNQELYFIGKDSTINLYAVPYHTQGSLFQPGTARLLFHGDFRNSNPFPAYDVSPDGKHFAMLELAREVSSATTPPTVVLNWFDRVAQMVAASQK